MTNESGSSTETTDTSGGGDGEENDGSRVAIPRHLGLLDVIWHLVRSSKWRLDMEHFVIIINIPKYHIPLQ